MNYRYDTGDMNMHILIGKKVMLEIKGSVEGYTPLSNIINDHPLLYSPFEVSTTYNHFGRSVIWRDNMHKIILVKNEHIETIRKMLIDHAFNDITNKDIEEFNSIEDVFIFMPIQYSMSPNDMRDDIHKQNEMMIVYDDNKVKNLLYEKVFNKVREASVQYTESVILLGQGITIDAPVMILDNIPF